MGGEDPEFDRLIAESLAPDDVEEVQLNESILDQMATLGLDREKIIAVRFFFSYIFFPVLYILSQSVPSEV
jgi:hypothetical protein